MKTYKTKSTAQRAAAKALGVPNKQSDVAKVALVGQNEDGLWLWESIKEKQEKAQRVVKPKKEKGSYAGKTWKRPSDGTKTGRVRELADQLKNRKAVMEAAAKEGLNLNMVGQQYHRWQHQA